MATSKIKKAEQLKALEALFSEAQGIAFVQFNGATVPQVETARQQAREQGMTYTVIKKTLMAIAATNTNVAQFVSDDLEGSVAVIVSPTDSIAPAAAIKTMIQDTYNKATKTSPFDFAGAVFEGKFLDAQMTAQLADTPTREESLAKIIAMLQSGPQKIHGILNSGLQKMHGVMDQAEKFAS
jgi:ribosomal protein L10